MMQAFLDRLDARSLLAIMLLGGVMALAFLLAVKAPDSDTFKILLGGLMTTGFAGVIQWYYGSSSGSAAKDEALAATSIKQNETIAEQGKALASSAPVVTTTTIDPGPPPTATTTTTPVEPQAKTESEPKP